MNRVILATDGDFNVGIYDTEMLKTLVADQRKSGIALTTLGFGQGNYNDQMAEQLADVGNGGHDVTAIYEITLVGSGGESVSPLRYGKTTAANSGKSNEIALLKLRYKQPGNDQSQLIEKPMLRSIISAKPSDRMKLAASLAAYADLLRGGKNSGHFKWNDVRQLAASVSLPDSWGYRNEFMGLIDQASRLIETPDVAQISE